MLVGDQAAVGRSGQAALQSPERLLGLALGALASVIGLPGGRVAELHDRHQVQGMVELAVAGPGRDCGPSRWGALASLVGGTSCSARNSSG
jgi:hypothetical protein